MIVGILFGGIDMLKLVEGLINTLINKKVLTLPEAAVIVENAKDPRLKKQQVQIIKTQKIIQPHPGMVPFERLAELRKKLGEGMTEDYVDKVIKVLREMKVVE